MFQNAQIGIPNTEKANEDTYKRTSKTSNAKGCIGNAKEGATDVWEDTTRLLPVTGGGCNRQLVMFALFNIYDKVGGLPLHTSLSTHCCCSAAAAATCLLLPRGCCWCSCLVAAASLLLPHCCCSCLIAAASLLLLLLLPQYCSWCALARILRTFCFQFSFTQAALLHARAQPRAPGQY